MSFWVLNVVMLMEKVVNIAALSPVTWLCRISTHHMPP